MGNRHIINKKLLTKKVAVWLKEIFSEKGEECHGDYLLE